MLADVPADFGGRPPRSRRAARPPSWRRRRDRTPRIRAARQTRSTTSEGLRGCPRDAGSSSDSIFPTRGRPAAHHVPSTVSRGTRRETSDRFSGWSVGVWIGTSLYGRYFFSSSAVARRPPSTSTASEVSSTACLLCIPADTFLIHLFEHTRPPGPRPA